MSAHARPRRLVLVPRERRLLDQRRRARDDVRRVRARDPAERRHDRDLQLRPGRVHGGRLVRDGHPRREVGRVVLARAGRGPRRRRRRRDPGRPAVASAPRRLLRDLDARVQRDRAIRRGQLGRPHRREPRPVRLHADTWNDASARIDGWLEHLGIAPHFLLPLLRRQPRGVPRARGVRRAARPVAVGTRAQRDPRGRGRRARAGQEHVRRTSSSRSRSRRRSPRSPATCSRSTSRSSRRRTSTRC